MWKQIDAEWELEIIQQATKKSLDSGTGRRAVCGPPGISARDRIPLLPVQVVAIKARDTVLDGLTGSPVKIPEQTGTGTVYWVPRQ